MISFKQYLTAIVLFMPLGLCYAGENPLLASILKPLEIHKTAVERASPEAVMDPTITESRGDSLARRLPISSHSGEALLTRVKSVDILKRLGKFLQSQFEMEGELKLFLARDWPEVVLKTEDYRVEFTDYPRNALSSSFHLGFRIIAEDKEVGSWVVPVLCELWRPVFYAHKRLRRGSEIVESDLTEQVIDSLKMRERVVPSSIDIAGYEMASTVVQGSPLFWKDITVKPDVRKGKIMDIIAEEGGMKLMTKGIAMQSGLVSDFIKVRNLQSKRDLEAQIINENTVRVYF